MVLRMSSTPSMAHSHFQENNLKQTKGMLGNPLDHIRHALTLPFPRLQQKAELQKNRSACLVGAGPSRDRNLEHLKQAQQQNYEIWALNDAYAWLAENGIKPDVHVMSSPLKEHAEYVPQKTEAILFYASRCHPEVFLRASAASPRVILWHSQVDGIESLKEVGEDILIDGGEKVGMLAISLAFVTGIQEIHLFGYDSSFDDETAVEPQEESVAPTSDQKICVQVEDRQFVSSISLAQQINEFRDLLKRYIPEGVRITLHGEGLLPFAMKKMTAEKPRS